MEQIITSSRAVTALFCLFALCLASGLILVESQQWVCMGLALVHMKSTAMPLAWASFMQYKGIRDDLRDISKHPSSSVRCITLGYLECLHCLCLWVKLLEAPLKKSHVSQQGGPHEALTSDQYPGSVREHVARAWMEWEEGQIIFYCKEKNGKTWTPKWESWLARESRRLPHTQRWDTIVDVQVPKINFNLAQTLTIGRVAGTTSRLPCLLAVGCWALPHFVLLVGSFPQCHFS